jgi:hypothetical protein
VAAFAVLMAFGWWVTAQPPFSAAGTVGVLLAGVVVIVLGRLWRRRVARAGGGDDTESNDGIWIWAAISIAVLVWELITFVGHPRDAHPTISSITDAWQAEHVIRWLLFGGWLAVGWSLAVA